MASLAAGIVDPTKAGKYPVVLSDALLGKDPKEIFTGVRYNYKPTLSSATAPAQARIKPASTSKKAPSTYDLSFQDDGGRYQYKGTRGAEDGQYVLIFDPTREVFVLHKVDSMFNMNLVQTPSNDDPKSLRRQHDQLESHSASSSAKAAGPSSNGKQSAKAKNEESKKPAPKPRKPAAKSKESKAEEKPALAMPQAKPAPKPAPKPRHTPADSEEESSDDDFGLTIENPGGAPPTGVTGDFSPNLFGIRRFSEFIPEDEEGENDDADGEDDDEDNFEHFKLPSPIRQMQETSAPPRPTQTNEPEEDEDDEEMEDVQQERPAEADDNDLDDEMDLEAALMAELDGGQESDVSEEE
ncbi:RNA polymerase II transcription elongation factor-domain-containing protein [Hypomontagnella monticulosa]|nr:RNA polymerase II transcription elongation factor-domain-containing protein [Hypomontagnella monticulosa]